MYLNEWVGGGRSQVPSLTRFSVLPNLRNEIFLKTIWGPPPKKRKNDYLVN